MAKKKIIRPFEGVGYFTSFPNDAIDYVMPICKPNTWKLVCLVIRKTIGFHKKEDEISWSQFKELTGMASYETLSNALNDAVEMGVFLKNDKTHTHTYKLNKRYEYRIGDEKDTKTVSKKDTKTVDTKEKVKDIKIKPLTKAQLFTKELEALENLFSTETGIPYDLEEDWELDPKGMNKLWRMPIRRMYKIAG